MNINILKESYGTLSETINGLIKIGYTKDFNVNDGSILRANITQRPKNFQIDKIYRFEGTSDPNYQSILYAISSVNHNIKGTLVDGYGNSSNAAVAKLVEKLLINNKPIIPSK